MGNQLTHEDETTIIDGFAPKLSAILNQIFGLINGYRNQCL
jgi:hypothetical protein